LRPEYGDNLERAAGSLTGNGVPPRLSRAARRRVNEMPRHDVDMSIPTTKMVLHADVVFEVRSDGEKFGELRISKGSVDWIPANAQIPAKLSWEQFDRVMREHRH
jgi:hypothetical protein